MKGQKQFKQEKSVRFSDDDDSGTDQEFEEDIKKGANILRSSGHDDLDGTTTVMQMGRDQKFSVKKQNTKGKNSLAY